MTAQAWIGVLFVFAGVLVKVAQAAGLLGAGEIGLVGEVSNLGMLLLGKELWPGSPESLAVKARTSPKPPPIPPEALALLMSIATPLALTFALQACAGAEKTVHDAQDHVAQMRERSAAAAADLREDLDAAASSINIARSAVEIACGFYRIEQCTAAESTIAVLEAAHKAASTAVDSMERSGLVLESVAAQAGHVVEQASALSATVRALEEAVRHAVDQASARAPVGPVVQPASEGPEGAAPAAVP